MITLTYDTTSLNVNGLVLENFINKTGITVHRNFQGGIVVVTKTNVALQPRKLILTFENCNLANLTWFDNCIGKVITIANTSMGTLTGIIVGKLLFNDVSVLEGDHAFYATTTPCYHYDFTLEFELT